MAVEVRKWVVFSEEILEEGGRPLERPLRKVAVAAVLKNPYAGAWSENIDQLIDAGEWLATELMDRAKAALGSPVEAYGKGGIVGEQGETEHVAALLHPKFGAPVRAAAMEICVPDAPATDEIVVAVAVTTGGRPHARVGGLRAEDAVGEDGLR